MKQLGMLKRRHTRHLFGTTSARIGRVCKRTRLGPLQSLLHSIVKHRFQRHCWLYLWIVTSAMRRTNSMHPETLHLRWLARSANSARPKDDKTCSCGKNCTTFGACNLVICHLAAFWCHSAWLHSRPLQVGELCECFQWKGEARPA